jgi:hypothetical protein
MKNIRLLFFVFIFLLKELKTSFQKPIEGRTELFKPPLNSSFNLTPMNLLRQINNNNNNNNNFTVPNILIKSTNTEKFLETYNSCTDTNKSTTYLESILNKKPNKNDKLLLNNTKEEAGSESTTIYSSNEREETKDSAEKGFQTSRKKTYYPIYKEFLPLSMRQFAYLPILNPNGIYSPPKVNQQEIEKKNTLKRKTLTITRELNKFIKPNTNSREKERKKLETLEKNEKHVKELEKELQKLCKALEEAKVNLAEEREKKEGSHIRHLKKEELSNKQIQYADKEIQKAEEKYTKLEKEYTELKKENEDRKKIEDEKKEKRNTKISESDFITKKCVDVLRNIRNILNVQEDLFSKEQIKDPINEEEEENNKILLKQFIDDIIKDISKKENTNFLEKRLNQLVRTLQKDASDLPLGQKIVGLIPRKLFGLELRELSPKDILEQIKQAKKYYTMACIELEVKESDTNALLIENENPITYTFTWIRNNPLKAGIIGASSTAGVFGATFLFSKDINPVNMLVRTGISALLTGVGFFGSSAGIQACSTPCTICKTQTNRNNRFCILCLNRKIEAENKPEDERNEQDRTIIKQFDNAK